MAGRAYSAVHKMDEIPPANRPHIVKLHRSFPVSFPFIFTEEDYRTVSDEIYGVRKCGPAGHDGIRVLESASPVDILLYAIR